MPLVETYQAVRRKALDRVPVPLWRRLVRRDVISLYYHMISDRELPHVLSIGSYKDEVQFEADLAYLSENGHLLSYDELRRHRLHGRGVPGGAFHITFDDGFRECCENACPALRRKAASATFFIPTDFIDNRDLIWVHKIAVCVDRVRRTAPETIASVIETINGRFGAGLDRRAALVAWLNGLRQSQGSAIQCACEALGVDPADYLRTYRPYLTQCQIERMAADGFTIGAHTTSHCLLEELSHPEDIEREIVESCRIIADITGRKQVPFAFPFHGFGVDRALLADIRRRHDVIGLIFDTGQLRRDREFVVHRVPADRTRHCRPGESNMPFLLRRAYADEQRLL